MGPSVKPTPSTGEDLQRGGKKGGKEVVITKEAALAYFDEFSHDQVDVSFLFSSACMFSVVFFVAISSSLSFSHFLFLSLRVLHLLILVHLQVELVTDILCRIDHLLGTPSLSVSLSPFLSFLFFLSCRLFSSFSCLFTFTSLCPGMNFIEAEEWGTGEPHLGKSLSPLSPSLLSLPLFFCHFISYILIFAFLSLYLFRKVHIHSRTSQYFLYYPVSFCYFFYCCCCCSFF